MMDAAALLKDMKNLLPKLEADIRLRLVEVPQEGERLQSLYQQARQECRTGAVWEAWREEQITQAAVAWLLACVFVRFLEDNGLVEQPWLAAPGLRRTLALDQHTLYFRANPAHSDRDYLWHLFRQVARFPVMAPLLDPRFNPLWRLAPSGDGARMLLDFWQQIDPDSGLLKRDFTDPGWDTRFLGDLYQDLSEEVRKKFALLQTPHFIESFILDRTLTPAIQEFGLARVRLIDPTCGSGHFLLGAFYRLFDLWRQREPGTNGRMLAQRALDGVWGVDVNPYAVAIARFRLLLAALQRCGITRVADAPGFRIHLATGDSLLHGPRFRYFAGLQRGLFPEMEELQHVLETEDKEALGEILGQQYHAVVGNPPYITPKDAVLNQAYRGRYSTCHRQYSLGVPFTERFFDLAMPEKDNQPAGYVGLITANSFMKREFGTKLIESFFKLVDLNTVIDTSGAYIPGHGTPTVILFGRHRSPLLSVVRTVQGIRGEPGTPEDAEQGKVWSSITGMVDQPGRSNEFISVVDTPRAVFAVHPWSLGGGGASELKESLEKSCIKLLMDDVSEIGFVCMTRADDIYFAPRHALKRFSIDNSYIIENIEGDRVRDWSIHEPNTTLFPYSENLTPVSLPEGTGVHRFLWSCRTILWLRREPNGNHKKIGLTWFEWSRFQRERFLSPLSITFAFVATHNHFVLDRGGKIFNRSAPVIKLPQSASEGDHLALLGLLNSSTACFWMKQTFHNKGSTVDQHGARQITIEFENFYEFTGTGLKSFPIPSEKPLTLATQLDQLAQQRQAHLPAQLSFPLTRQELDTHRDQARSLLHRMIALQEELDWQCYRFYGITEEDLTCPGEPPEVQLGERAFEIVMARAMAAGDLETTWFERHGSRPITQLPSHWPGDYQQVVEKRIQRIENHPNIRLIEQPEYKRRWNLEPWPEQEARAVREWLLDRLEAMAVWRQEPPSLTTCARLADALHHDDDFLAVAQLYRGRADFDLTNLVVELVSEEAVPFLPVLRYTESGLIKRRAWERTWALQRREDAGEAVGDIPVPPKYASSDFKSTTFWRLRGKLDVPKERFILYSQCEKTADPTPLIAWAGWNHLQQAQAIASHTLAMKDGEGWSAERLTPLLAGLLALLPWLKQWHNEMDPLFGTGMGDYFNGFVDEELRTLGLTREAVQNWQPVATGRRRGGKKTP